MNMYEGSHLKHLEGQSDEYCMTCKVCWYSYNPRHGDNYWQIPPNTPFSALPDFWRCPQCDGAKHQFLRVSKPR